MTADEARILDALLAGRHPVLEVLRSQRSFLNVSQREQSGSGFHIHFQLPKAVPRLLEPKDLTLADVVGHVSGIQCGFVLFVREGTLCDLEGLVWDAAGEMPADWQVENLAYLGNEANGSPQPERDLRALLRRWSTS